MLGGEKRFKDSFFVFWGDAGARVGDDDLQEVIGRFGAGKPGEGTTAGPVGPLFAGAVGATFFRGLDEIRCVVDACADNDQPIAVHCVGGVEHQIDKDLFEIVTFGVDDAVRRFKLW